MAGTRNVSARPLARLTDIEGRALQVLVDLPKGDQRLRQARSPPGVHATLQLADKVLVPDLQALLDEIPLVLVGRSHKDERPLRWHDPADPGREGGTKRDGQRARNVAAGKVRKRPDVDQGRPQCLVTPQLVDRERRELRRCHPIQTHAPLVHAAQPEEVGRVGAETLEEGPDEGILAGRAKERILVALSPQ